ncbi:SSU ribosomal protein S9P [Saccharothrix variisporea]|uniref:Small ribosomal subunit protein uS9 n=1 Tax=Saccharothrix variisporea TaxID=543527 RepID=A0A495XD32_9PSEU|nr:SSU ribosomal protein S9P [Saccharothrix variisporea]
MTEPYSEENDVTTPEVETEAVEAETAVDAVESDVDGAEDEAAEPAPAPVVRPVLSAGAHHLAQTVGRRKEAIVRVRLLPGTGKFTLNGKSLETYFPNKVHQQLIREPLVTTEKPETFDVIANLSGGGITGQAGALRLAIARALVAVDSEDRPVLKKAGFLTRDPRVKERKKYGLKKARKAPQYSKR